MAATIGAANEVPPLTVQWVLTDGYGTIISTPGAVTSIDSFLWDCSAISKFEST